MKHILVTGAAGFFGSQLLPKLKQSGYQVTGLDRNPGSDIHLEVADLIDIDQYDTVIHLANTARIEPSWKDPISYITNNVSTTLRFFQQCQHAGIKRFFYFSSSSVYGNNDVGVQREDSPLCPTNPYATSKATAEQLLTMYSHLGSTELIIVRPFTMYGATMDTGVTGLAVGKYVRSYVRGDPLVIHGTGLQRRDFLHVDDAVDMMLVLLNHTQGSGVYNLGSGHSVSIIEIAKTISTHHRYCENRPGPEYNTCADVTKIKQMGYTSKIKILDWLAEQKLNNFKEFTCL
jgi:nucleoside-diphosphate-sugar epimerase